MINQKFKQKDRFSFDLSSRLNIEHNYKLIIIISTYIDTKRFNSV